MTKSNLKRKWFILAYNFQVSSITEGNQSRKLEAGTEDAEATGEWPSLFPYTLQDQLPRCGNAHNELGTPWTIIPLKNAPKGLPTDQSCGGIFSIKVPSS